VNFSVISTAAHPRAGADVKDGSPKAARLKRQVFEFASHRFAQSERLADSPASAHDDAGGWSKGPIKGK
jgi:hypothetical protein